MLAFTFRSLPPASNTWQATHAAALTTARPFSRVMYASAPCSSNRLTPRGFLPPRANTVESSLSSHTRVHVNTGLHQLIDRLPIALRRYEGADARDTQDDRAGKSHRMRFLSYPSNQTAPHRTDESDSTAVFKEFETVVVKFNDEAKTSNHCTNSCGED